MTTHHPKTRPAGERVVLQAPPTPPNEDERLAALHALGILDTPPEERFDRITRLARKFFQVPIAMISLVDANRQWFKSCLGLEERFTSREVSFCAHAVAAGDVLVIPDALDDERFHDNPLVAGAPHIRFYAGCPLHSASGHLLGTLCILDTQPRELDRTGLDTLCELAAIAEGELGAVETTAALRRQMESEAMARRAQEEAERASRAKSMFLTNMSHELRTPLNAILGYSEMLEEEAVDRGAGDLVPDLRKINAAGRHLLGLINDILDLSKVEAGKMDVFVEEVDLRLLVQELEAIAEPLVAANRNTWHLKVAGELPPMWTDALKLRQILVNLLSNAAKFTSNGTVTLGARHEGPQMVFWVQDTGIGMSGEELNRLFNEFTQADPSTTRKYGGTGLGLALCRSFARLLGGDVEVASEPGAGSTFTCRVPVSLEVPSPRELPAAAEADDAAGGHGPLVLVVDDDPSARELLTRMLRREGYRVAVAADGRTGLQLAVDQRPAAITLDVEMPGMDGWETLTALKAQPELADTPILMVTMVDDRSRGYALGVSEFLFKPVDRARLLHVLGGLVDDGGQGPVLVVDDEDANRDVLRRALQREGLRVVEARNGVEALEALDREWPCLIMLDLTMPTMDGFEFLEAYERMGRPGNVPIVVLTALDLTAEQRGRLQSAALAVLQRGDFSLDAMFERIRSVVESSRPNRRRAAPHG